MRSICGGCRRGTQDTERAKLRSLPDTRLLRYGINRTVAKYRASFHHVNLFSSLIPPSQSSRQPAGQKLTNVTLNVKDAWIAIYKAHLINSFSSPSHYHHPLNFIVAMDFFNDDSDEANVFPGSGAAEDSQIRHLTHELADAAAFAPQRSTRSTACRELYALPFLFHPTSLLPSSGGFIDEGIEARHWLGSSANVEAGESYIAKSLSDKVALQMNRTRVIAVCI
ncbi:hypothetical protein DFH07DRAFT_820411 [Mycena maculata]|uniref:Uncharacterized protein n=1 Tax=Mycena maculata TaxID=230809 RepID=A0AAD7J462_9AGAR|nr:hypothetical protein DFH07DRAFT_820411 [Mycena maculata]